MQKIDQPDILQKIKERSAVVAIIGLGYVGLPLAIAFAKAGFKVIGIDVNQNRVEAINRGESFVEDIPSESLAQYTGNHPDKNISEPSLSATTDFDALHDVDAAIICVPTPLGKTKDPDMSYLVSAADEIAQRLHPGMLIVLESTTYPGTTEELILPCLKNAHGQKKEFKNDENKR